MSVFHSHLAEAEAALRRDDLPAAAGHLALAAAIAPTAPGLLRRLDKFVDACDDPAALVPLNRTTYFGVAAVRVYVLGKRGFLEEAFALLKRLAAAHPSQPVMDYALPWLDAGCLEPAEARDATRLFLSILHHRCPEVVADAADQAALRRWLPHVQPHRAAARDDDLLRTWVPNFLRKANLLDEALACALEFHNFGPSPHSAIALANAYRAKGDESGWYEACHEALRLDPENVGVRLDLGDGLWERLEQPEEAERWYTEVLQREPEHAWAWPSLLALQFLQTGRTDARERLVAFAAADPANNRAREMIERTWPYFDCVPPLALPRFAQTFLDRPLPSDVADKSHARTMIRIFLNQAEKARDPQFLKVVETIAAGSQHDAKSKTGDLQTYYRDEAWILKGILAELTS